MFHIDQGCSSIVDVILASSQPQATEDAGRFSVALNKRSKLVRKRIINGSSCFRMISDRITSKTVMITGGTGSFGNRVAQFLENFNPRRIIIYSRDEKKQYEMEQRHREYQYIVGDVRDRVRLSSAMKGVDVVFHAAALKQVPSCESHPYEAVKTNILGSQYLAEAAIKNDVGIVVGLSTDKAVKPINAMGVSKAMMEKIICSQNIQLIDTRFCCVRYGNVMGSRGSVIPLFLRQIAEGKKLTITDPNMTRFLMTLEQSIKLVLHAVNHSAGGEVFVKKAPAATVSNLARAVLAKYGDGDFDRIEIIGVRPGEKRHEVLVNEYEMTRSDETEEFFEIYPEYRPMLKRGQESFGLEYTSANTVQLEKIDQIRDLLDFMGDTNSYI
jgi:UDP-N-acetylglucosamine 4,6-dehydratase